MSCTESADVRNVQGTYARALLGAWHPQNCEDRNQRMDCCPLTEGARRTSLAADPWEAYHVAGPMYGWAPILAPRGRTPHPALTCNPFLSSFGNAGGASPAFLQQEQPDRHGLRFQSWFIFSSPPAFFSLFKPTRCFHGSSLHPTATCVVRGAKNQK